jgi:hypothetical protein
MPESAFCGASGVPEPGGEHVSKMVEFLPVFEPDFHRWMTIRPQSQKSNG